MVGFERMLSQYLDPDSAGVIKVVPVNGFCIGASSYLEGAPLIVREPIAAWWPYIV